ncbi:MAG: 16S rRNA (cytosine(1402)-N(4))-methyltransferase RsmH [marine benthic group bacterium]|jgi:16S rRNA (cytosine1402-N4)-methyltransferase|nr:16S rRNA (cytosine(1402)-N(4))-methyltransferase RsmH [Candidatus Benthicola marisminoris]
MSGQEFEHEPVMVAEVLGLLEPERGGLYLDGTLGGGGHAERILASGPDTSLIGLDQDADAVAAATRRLADFGDRVTIRAANFRHAAELLQEDIDVGLDGALLDLGVSSHQIDTTARGFSFRRGTPLNMRMGGTTGGWRTAADLLNTAHEEELGRIFRDYGEERRWRGMSREIARRRRREPLSTADDLMAAASVVYRGPLTPRDKARLFQAVRIAVNDELEALREGLHEIAQLLKAGGRLVVISYHSLEDRIVKEAFREWSRECVCPPELPVCRCRGRSLGRRLTRKPVRPSPAEVEVNPRARSARLRAWERS